MLTSPLPPFTSLKTAHCPACHQDTLSAAGISRLVELTEGEEAVFDALIEAASPNFDGWLTWQQSFEALFCDDPDGGPEPSKMYEGLYATLDSLAPKIERFGYRIERATRKGARIHLLPGRSQEPALRSFAGKSSGFRRQFRPVGCHCCGQQIVAPTLEQVMSAYRLQPRERQILRAIDGAAGRVATNAWLLELMFEGDPALKSERQKYSALKVALSYARAKLKGSGVAIRNLGYRQGYMITDEVSR